MTGCAWLRHRSGRNGVGSLQNAWPASGDGRGSEFEGLHPPFVGSAASGGLDIEDLVVTGSFDVEQQGSVRRDQ